jgi:hypothetical protein
MAITKRTMNYNVTQKEAIEKGSQKRKRLIGMLMRFLDANQQEAYSHFIVSSFPGLGKTHLTILLFKEAGVTYYIISGNISMFGFAIALAVIQFLNPALLTIYILVDDCDSLFQDVNSINTLKNVLGKNGKIRYEKSLASQLKYLTETQRQAIEHFGGDGRMGFVVPTHNLRFVFTSNLQLPNDESTYLATIKRSSKSHLMVHQNAIRSRCRVLDINLTEEEKWGWITDCIQNTDCLTSKGITKEQISDIADYLWLNWDDLSERSIRTAEKMAETIIANPNPLVYPTIWDIDFLTN